MFLFFLYTFFFGLVDLFIFISLNKSFPISKKAKLISGLILTSVVFIHSGSLNSKYLMNSESFFELMFFSVGLVVIHFFGAIQIYFFGKNLLSKIKSVFNYKNI